MNDLAGFAVVLAAAIAAPARADNSGYEKNLSRLELIMDETQESGGIANLPYARGRRFHSLDAYLAHLERQGAIDLPWWRQIRPGVYERVTNMPGRAPERATRAELMRRFGFAR
jgi:hypothetical protein